MRDVTVISSRRSYEFAQDDIRLSLLSNQLVVSFLKETFRCEVGVISTPMETFGPVPNTLPPGLVLNYGITPFPKQSGTAIRFIHVEQRRVVIDVVGPSDVLDDSFGYLKEKLSDLQTGEGFPAIGEPTHFRDFSEIRATLDFGPEALIPRPVLSAALEELTRENDSRRIVPVMTLRMTAETEYPGGAVPSVDTYSLDLRAGTNADDHVYYSAGPLDSQKHIEFLETLESQLQPR